MRYICSIVLALALVLGLAAGPALSGDKIELTDTAGRKVAVPADPARIVCLGPGCLRLVTYLQALDKVAGVEALERRMGGRPYYLAHRAVMDKLPVISPGGPSAINKKPDLEAILKVNPEVVFATYMEAALADEVQATLGLPVVVLTYGRFAAFDEIIYESLRLLGRVLNRADRAEAVIGFIEAGRADLLRRVDGLVESARPTVFVGGLGFRGSHGLESTDTLYIPFGWLKARSVIAKKSERGHVFLGKEELLGLQPEVIFVDGTGLELVAADYGKKPDFYRALKAFQDNRVYALFPFNWYTTNVGTAMADAYTIGKITQPDRFGDVDPAAKADQIYKELVGAPVGEAMAGLYGPLGGRPPFIK